MTYTCSRCGDTYKEEIPMTAHTPGESVRENEIEPTCISEGSYDEVVYCTVCNTELSRKTKTIDKKAHIPVVIPGKAATCTEDGLTDGTKCSVCDTILLEQNVIPPQV